MNNRMDRPMVILLVVLSGLLFLSSGLYGMTGVVYIDQNEDLQYDEGDLPIAGAVVSDGFIITVTDEHGVFTLTPNPDAKFVFLSIPNATKPLAGWYKKLEGNKDFDFPLKKVMDDSPLTFIQITDTHYATNKEEFKKAFYDRRMKVLPQGVLDFLTEEANEIAPDFVMLTGDIVADAKRPPVELVDKWMKYMADDFAVKFKCPLFAVEGNHDIVRDAEVGKAVYEKYFGPTYYSFNVKGSHFIVLDTMWLSPDGKLTYGPSSAAEVSWLRQDLATVAPLVPVIVFCHEPTPGWADTEENAEVMNILTRAGITALLDGSWHLNFLLHERYPFYELVTSAVCGSWWEGEATDGSKFGYRVFQFNRGRLESIWREIDIHNVEFQEPRAAIATWNGTLQAATWGEARSVSWTLDDNPTVNASTFYNGMWTVGYGNLNFSALEDGYHLLKVEFRMVDGTTVSSERSLYVVNPDIDIKEIRAHPDAFLGRNVAVPELSVKAIMPGEAISASDGSSTIILNKLPFTVQRGDNIGVVGIYRVHSATFMKPYDPIFFTKYEQQE